MLSFQITERKTIQIGCDAEGVGILLAALGKLMEERSSHVHLRGPSFGGKQLNEKTAHGEDAVHEVIIDYVEATN